MDMMNNSINASRHSSIELNLTAPLEDKSLEAVITDSNVHKFDKL